MRSKLAMGGLILGAAWGAYRRLRRPISLQCSYGTPGPRSSSSAADSEASVARGLARALRGIEDVGVALVDRMNYTTFWPMVPSVIPSNAEVRHVAQSLRRILKPLGVEYFQDEVVGVDFEARRVKTLGAISLMTTLSWLRAAARPTSAPQGRKERHGCQGSARRSACT